MPRVKMKVASNSIKVKPNQTHAALYPLTLLPCQVEEQVLRIIEPKQPSEWKHDMKERRALRKRHKKLTRLHNQKEVSRWLVELLERAMLHM